MISILVADTSILPLNKESQILKELIDSFRVANKRKPLPVYERLSYVAMSHVVELNNGYHDTTLSLYSWPNPVVGTTLLIYKNDIDVLGSLYKPQEVANINTPGYEMIHMHVERDSYCSGRCAFNYFVNKPMYRDMMLENRYGRWARMGLWIREFTSSVWYIKE